MKLSCKRTRRQGNVVENVKPSPKLTLHSVPVRQTRSISSTTTRLCNLYGQKPLKGTGRLSSAFGLGNFVSAACIFPQAGDIIEFDRKLYSHWALYVGDKQVIHVSGETADIASEDVFVRQSRLEDVANDSLVRINNKCVPAKERKLKALEVNRIVTNARKNLGKRVDYNMLSNTAEHYVTKWRYGVAWSDQADTLLTVMNRRRSQSPPTPEISSSVGSTSSEDCSSCGSATIVEETSSVDSMKDGFSPMSLLAGLTAIFQTDLHSAPPTEK